MTEPNLVRLILEQMQDQQKQLRRIDGRLGHIEINLGILKAKAAFIGAIAGLLPSLAIWFFSRG
jgi:hypothetical protein